MINRGIVPGQIDLSRGDSRSEERDRLGLAAAGGNTHAVAGGDAEAGAAKGERAEGARDTSLRLVQDYFRRHGVLLNNCIELGNMEAIKELAKIGVGVFVPWIARPELENGTSRSLPLGRWALKRCWGVAHLTQHRLSLGEQTFVGLCQTVCEALATPVGA